MERFSNCARRSFRNPQWIFWAFHGRKNGDAEGESELTNIPGSFSHPGSPFSEPSGKISTLKVFCS